MRKILRIIITILAIILAITLLLWARGIEPGVIIAGLSLFFASLKANLFGTDEKEEKQERIKKEHSLKREKWNMQEDTFIAKEETIQEKIKLLVSDAERTRNKIREMDSTAFDNNLSEDEILKRLNKL